VNISKEELIELNDLLKSPELDIPSFRREVRSCGANYSWLQKNLTKKNPNVPARLKELLNINSK